MWVIDDHDDAASRWPGVFNVTFDERMTRQLVAWRWPLLAIGLLLAGLAYGPSQRLEFDRSIENMFAPTDPLLVPYQQSRRTFGGDEIALAAYVDPRLLTAEGLARVDAVTSQLKAVDGVKSVLSLTTTPFGVGIVNSPLLDSFMNLLEGFNIGPDRQTTAVVCMLTPEINAPQPREQTVEQLRAVIEAHDQSGVLTGEPVMVVDGFKYLEEDGTLLGRASTLLLMATIFLCFRSVRWVIVPIAVVNVTLLCTKGLLAVSQFRLSMVSSMLWAIVTVVGVGMVVHVILRFREERHRGHSPREALLACGGFLVTPIIWTCLTDTAGFGSLLGARVGPINDFGKMMTMGSLVALASAAAILPGLALWGKFDPDPHRAWGERNLDVGLHSLIRWIERWPWPIGLATAALVGWSMLGYLWLDVETDFTKNFRATSPVVKSYEFVESRLGGAGVWDVLIPAPSKIDMAFLDRVRRFERRLREEVTVQSVRGQRVPGLTKVLSVTDALDSMGGEGSLLNNLPVENQLQLFEQQMPVIWHALYGEDPEQGGRPYLRIMLRAKERQPSAQKNLLIQQVRDLCAQEFPEGQVTGFFVLLTRLIDSMTGDQWRTFAIATGLIGLMMLVAFGSPLLAVVALVPNVLPNLMVIGIMGWFDLRINMGAAMIAAVSMGLAVDSTVHYLIEYRYFRKRGYSQHDALDAVHQNVGRAVIFSTLALMIGFWALTLSQFIPLVYFGVLVSVSLFGGMLCNLILLPLLLKIIDRGEAGS